MLLNDPPIGTRDEKLLTVSVAAYNVEKYICQCLSSLILSEEKMNQLEVLVIDDGGTDKTKDLVDEFVSQYPNVFRFIHKENGGWGSTVNLGIQLATGKYFKQLDGDDYFNTEALSPFLEILESNTVDVVYSPHKTFDDKTGKISNSFLLDYDLKYNPISLEELYLIVPQINMHTCTFRTEYLKANNISVLENRFYTDVEFFLKSISFSQSIFVFNQPIYYYRLGREEQSVSSVGVAKHYKDNYDVISSLILFEQDNCFSDSRKRIIKKNVVHSIEWQIKALLLLNQIEELREFDKTIVQDYHLLASDFTRQVRRYRRNNYKFARLLFLFDQQMHRIRVLLRSNMLISSLYYRFRKYRF